MDQMTALAFWRGRYLYQIAPAREGPGFIGLRSGRVVATAPDRAGVMRALVMGERWRRRDGLSEVDQRVPVRKAGLATGIAPHLGRWRPDHAVLRHIDDEAITG